MSADGKATIIIESRGAEKVAADFARMGDAERKAFNETLKLTNEARRLELQLARTSKAGNDLGKSTSSGFRASGTAVGGVDREMERMLRRRAEASQRLIAQTRMQTWGGRDLGISAMGRAAFRSGGGMGPATDELDDRMFQRYLQAQAIREKRRAERMVAARNDSHREAERVLQAGNKPGFWTRMSGRASGMQASIMGAWGAPIALGLSATQAYSEYNDQIEDKKQKILDFDRETAGLMGVGDNQSKRGLIQREVMTGAAGWGVDRASLVGARFSLESAASNLDPGIRDEILRESIGFNKLQNTDMKVGAAALNGYVQIAGKDLMQGAAGVRQAANRLLYVADKGAIEIEDLATYLPGVLGSAQAMGYTDAEVLGAITAGTQKMPGTRPETIMTALRNMMLIAPQAEKEFGFKLSGNLADQMGQLGGVESQQLLDLFGRDNVAIAKVLADSSGEMSKHIEAVERLSGETSDAMRKIGMSWADSAHSVAELLKSVDEARKNVGLLNAQGGGSAVLDANLSKLGADMASSAWMPEFIKSLRGAFDDLVAKGSPLQAEATHGLIEQADKAGDRDRATRLEIEKGEHTGFGPVRKAVPQKEYTPEMKEQGWTFSPYKDAGGNLVFDTFKPTGKLEADEYFSLRSKHPKLTPGAYQQLLQMRVDGSSRGDQEAFLKSFIPPEPKKPSKPGEADFIGPLESYGPRTIAQESATRRAGLVANTVQESLFPRFRKSSAGRLLMGFGAAAGANRDLKVLQSRDRDLVQQLQSPVLSPEQRQAMIQEREQLRQKIEPRTAWEARGRHFMGKGATSLLDGVGSAAKGLHGALTPGPGRSGTGDLLSGDRFDLQRVRLMEPINRAREQMMRDGKLSGRESGRLLMMTGDARRKYMSLMPGAAPTPEQDAYERAYEAAMGDGKVSSREEKRLGKLRGTFSDKAAKAGNAFNPFHEGDGPSFANPAGPRRADGSFSTGGDELQQAAAAVFKEMRAVIADLGTAAKNLNGERRQTQSNAAQTAMDRHS